MSIVRAIRNLALAVEIASLTLNVGGRFANNGPPVKSPVV